MQWQSGHWRCNSCSILSADFNGNGRVDIGDAAKIAYYLVGKIDKL
ncbi:MAG: hypothetical protein ACE5KE_03250 [Methanosarcinales archaeon]